MPQFHIAACIVLAGGMLFSNGWISAARAQPCAPLTYNGNSYTVCEAPLSRYSIRFFWQKPDGAPYKYLSALPKTGKSGEKLAFALNGGMYHSSFDPVGLYIEDGKQLVRASIRGGSGNFHLRPNGVFYVGKDEAGVMETKAFLAAKPKAEFATQSGPMLVINGQLHPRIARASASVKARDGVCVRDRKVAVFAISENDVSFAAFMRLFRDRLKCHNALFLDGGSAPSLYIPSASRPGNMIIPLGPMIAVYEKP